MRLLLPLLALAVLAGCATDANQSPAPEDTTAAPAAETSLNVTPEVNPAATAPEPTALPEADENLQLATLNVKGMDCGGCAAEVHRLLTAAGASKAEIKVAEGLAEVRYDPTKTDADKLVAAFEDQTAFQVSISQ